MDGETTNTPQTTAPPPAGGPTAVQSNQNTNAALAYLVGWITGLIFLLTEKENDYIRFHAAQSLIVFGVLTLVSMVPVIGWMLTPIILPLWLVLLVLLMVQAYQGKRFKLPVVGDYAEQVKDKIGK